MRDPFRWLTVVLVVALGCALFWGGHQHRERERERVSAEADRQAFADLESQLTRAERARLASEAALNGQAESDIRRMFPESRSVPESATIDQFNAAVDRDPIWQPFFRKLERRRILARDGILIAALAIPPEKRAALEDLLVERTLSNRYIVHRLRETGRKFSAPQTLAAVGHATDAIDAKIKTLVGRDNAQKLREWNGAIYSYGTTPNGPVAQDAVTLSEAGFVLSTEQLVKLALIRYEVAVLDPDARAVPGSEPVDAKPGLTRQEKRLLAREAEVLSPAEIAVLRDWTLQAHRARAAVDILRAQFHIDASPTRR
jgi:hypothetical protein